MAGRLLRGFSDLADAPDQAHARAALREWAAEPAGLLAIIGPTGTGKTTLGMATMWASAEHVQPIFAPVGMTLAYLQERKRDGEGADHLDRLMEAELAYLDDVGVEVKAGYSGQEMAMTLYNIIGHRYELDLPTIVSTNLPLGQLDERLWSRLSDVNRATIIVLPGESLRNVRERELPGYRSIGTSTGGPDYHQYPDGRICPDCHCRPCRCAD